MSSAAGSGSGRNGRMRPALAAARALLLVLALAMAWAVYRQDFGGALPEGLFNHGREALHRAAGVALLGLLLAAVVWASELLRRRATRLGGLLAGLAVALLLLEGLVTVIDVGLVSRGAATSLGGPYRELRSAAGGWIWVKKGPPGSPLGLRGNPPRHDAQPRVLFLGDSYTEGSGAAPACNYPEVAAAELSRRLGRPVDALNAGVAGYGPVDAAALLRHLAADGWDFDAIVFQLFLENDFTDDLPATERRVVAGVNFRFPRSAFLRRFDPLDWRLTRYALFLSTAASLVSSPPPAAYRDAGACQLEPAPATAATAGVDPGLRELVMRRFRANYGPDARAEGGLVLRALGEMREVARQRGVPLVLVVFPDRILVDAALRRQLGIDLHAPGVDAERLARIARGVDLPRIEVAPALTDGSADYRPEDTHLSDLGNLRAGRFVGGRLAPLLAKVRAFGP